MRKNYLLMGASLFAATVTAQAQQRVVASLGFEDSDAKYTTEYALTPDLGSIHGDWVNVQGGDDWSEKYTLDKHSGEYCFRATNFGDTDANNWDRGFKIGLDNVKLQTPYRVSFWLKAPSKYEDASGNEQDTKITSWMSKGMENFDISLMGPDKSEFGLNSVSGLTGDWKRFTFVVFTPSRETVKEVVDSRSWVGNAEFPSQFGGTGETYKQHFDEEIPEMYFFIANMRSPVEYLLDDICVEEGVTVKEATFNSYAVKIDFGYKTNMAELARRNKGTIAFDPSTAKLFQNGEEITVEYVEGKEDGCLYVFPETELDYKDKIEVTFTGDDRLLYTSVVRPTAETGDVVVMGCSNEVAYYDEDIEVEAQAWSNPVVVSSTPANGQFGLTSSDVNEITITFANEVKIGHATAYLICDGEQKQVSMTLSEDGKTITIPASGLSDGEWTVSIERLENNIGATATEPTTISFLIGQGSGSVDVTEYYALNMEGLGPNTLPLGVSGVGDNEPRIGDGVTGYGGAPRIMGGNDNANQGIYWCQRGGSAENPGEVSFGKAYIETQDDQYPSIYLEPNTYVLTYKNAGWDGNGAGKYNLAVKDANGEAIFSEVDIANSEVVGQGPDASVVISTSSYEFKVTEAGYYYIEFTTSGGWGGQLLTALSLSNKPSSEAGYYMQMFNQAIENAEAILARSISEDNSETKANLENALNAARNGSYTTPDAIEAIVKELNTYATQLGNRITSYNDFVNGFNAAQEKYANLEGKYKQSDIARAVEDIIAEFSSISPSSLSDEELNEAAKNVKNISGQIDNVAAVVNTLTYQANRVADIALNVGNNSETADAVYELATDNTELIKAANLQNTAKIYALIAENALGDCLEVERVFHNSPMYQPEEAGAGEEVDDNGYLLATEGIDFDAYIKNPRFYTVSYGGNFNNGDEDLPGWTVEQYSSDEGYLQGTLHFTGDAASDTKPVSDIMLNNYGASDYRVSQVVTDLPVGVYDFRLDTRTVMSGVVFNAQNEMGIWDKYIFAQVDDEEPIMTPFSTGGYQQPCITIVKGLKVKKGSKVTIGVVEHYTSGLAEKDGAATDYWDTNTWVDNAKFYFVAPLEGFDYAKEAKELEAVAIETVNGATALEGIYNVNGIKVNALQKGINIVKMANGTTKKVLK